MEGKFESNQINISGGLTAKTIVYESTSRIVGKEKNEEPNDVRHKQLCKR